VAGTLGALLAERGATVVGRDAELGSLLEDAPPIVVVHGVAGAGKSSLLRAFRVAATARGATVVAVDGREVEPSAHAFQAAVGELDADVLLIDHAERLRLLDGWLRTRFLPSLPAHARVVIATRDAPGAVWRAAFGELLRTVPLGPLAPADAAEVLRRAGLEDAQAEWVNRFVRGHPLSLQLAASAVRERPDAPEDVVLPTVAQELAELWLAGLEPQTREALDAASVLRRVTLSLLGALLPGEAPQAAFERLGALPFVELGREGLVVHDTVREAVAALLRASDPVRWRAYRAAAWQQIRRELASSTGAARWASTADMIQLAEEPLVREAFFPSSVQHYAVETALPEDWPEIEAIVAHHEPAAEVELIRAWWAEVPHAFRVARHPRGIVVAFTVLAPLAEVPQRLLTRDPVCEPWRRHLRSDPVPRGQGVLLARTALARITGAAASPCFAALLRDMERASLEAGPALRRIYSVLYRTDDLAPIAPLGFELLPGARDIEHRDAWYRPIVCDLGPESVAGWVSGIAARDLPVQADGLDPGARELVLDGRRVGLTKLEFDLLGYLREREGQAVTREALLRDVWGYDWNGGANVVEVAVSGLRRKLGDRASVLQTVRGVGYRLQPH
jgi:Transcriptional regulatory protein, C terminal